MTSARELADLVAENYTRRGWNPLPLSRKRRSQISDEYYNAIIADPGALAPLIDIKETPVTNRRSKFFLNEDRIVKSFVAFWLVCAVLGIAMAATVVWAVIQLVGWLVAQ